MADPNTDKTSGANPRILMVGAGAVGGYFGGRLAQAGRNVTFLVRPKRAERLQASGLKVISPHGDFTITPQLAVTGEVRSTYDIVLAAVKAYTLEAAMDDFAPAIGNETMIIPFLNGMRHLDLLAERFGKTRFELDGAIVSFMAGRLATSISCQNDGRSNDWVYRLFFFAISVERDRCPS